jgi:glycosyltransferase involved in cell wall biosynthesis
MIKFTIITPSFNSAKWIAGCIESVAQQSYKNIEHLVIDGASKDGTREMLEKASVQHPHLRFVSEKDKGIYDAMNKGMRNASGDYVLFLGSDDRLHDESVLANIAHALQFDRPDIVYGNIQTVGDGLHGLKHGSIYDGYFDIDKLLKRNICHQAIFYSREILKKAGDYDIRYRFYADWAYNLKCFSLGRAQHIDLIIADYNTLGSSSVSDDPDFHASFFPLVWKHFGISIFNRRLKTHYAYLAYVGKTKIRRLRDATGVAYLVAACFHHPPYVRKLFTKALRRLSGLSLA